MALQSQMLLFFNSMKAVHSQKAQPTENLPKGYQMTHKPSKANLSDIMKQRLNYLARSQQLVWRKSDAEDQLIIIATSTVKLGDGSIFVLDGSLQQEGEMEKQKE